MDYNTALTFGHAAGAQKTKPDPVLPNHTCVFSGKYPGIRVCLFVEMVFLARESSPETEVNKALGLLRKHFASSGWA